jgi:hypothetical protein
MEENHSLSFSSHAHMDRGAIRLDVLRFEPCWKSESVWSHWFPLDE